MFFSWLIKNRHFKKGSDIKGQITPLLIIVMVVLLVAALVSINIGRIALDKTYSSNASDAGALAAASIYDAAFNELARSWTSPTDDASSPGGLNYKMFMNYLSSYSAYYVLYEGASNNIETAIIEALAGQALAIAAYVQAAIFPPIDTVWVLALTGAITAAAAGLLIWSAAREVEEFYLRAQYMLSITESFHDGQWNFYAVDTCIDNYGRFVNVCSAVGRSKDSGADASGWTKC